MLDSFLDSNVVIYSLGQDELKQEIALTLITKKPVMSIQVLNETSNIMRRKLGYNTTMTKAAINRLANESGLLVTVTIETINKAFDIIERYGFSYYDSLIVASALQTNCTTLYSEDMQHKQVIDDSLIIINPFKNR